MVKRGPGFWDYPLQGPGPVMFLQACQAAWKLGHELSYPFFSGLAVIQHLGSMAVFLPNHKGEL